MTHGSHHAAFFEDLLERAAALVQELQLLGRFGQVHRDRHPA